jgi:hypothetical protein
MTECQKYASGEGMVVGGRRSATSPQNFADKQPRPGGYSAVEPVAIQKRDSIAVRPLAGPAQLVQSLLGESASIRTSRTAQHQGDRAPR